jgi:hypothetical protein
MPNRVQAPSPWLVGLLPWVIDLLFKTSFLNTLWGALLWGLLLVIYFAQARLIDPNLKRYLNILLWAAGALWLSGWIKSFQHPVENPLKPSTALYFLHATFLVAAGGMLLIVLLASGLGRLKEKKIFTPRSKSQSSLNSDKNTSSRSNTPSLEGLLNLCSWSFGLVRVFWLLGCTLALIALAVHTHQITNQTRNSSHLSAWKDGLSKWIHDPSIWAVWLLAFVFVFSEKIWNKFKSQSFFRVYLYTALLGLLVVITILWSESGQMGHINQEFLR